MENASTCEHCMYLDEYSCCWLRGDSRSDAGLSGGKMLFLERCKEYQLPAPAPVNVTINPNLANEPTAIEQTFAKKHDENKAMMHLLPPSALLSVAQVFTYGAKKYAPYNWEKGMQHSRWTSAAMRHVNAYNGGENLDGDSGYHHLDHAIASLLILRAAIHHRVGVDDRTTLRNESEPK